MYLECSLYRLFRSLDVVVSLCVVQCICGIIGFSSFLCIISIKWLFRSIPIPIPIPNRSMLQLYFIECCFYMVLFFPLSLSLSLFFLYFNLSLNIPLCIFQLIFHSHFGICPVASTLVFLFIPLRCNIYSKTTMLSMFL